MLMYSIYNQDQLKLIVEDYIQHKDENDNQMLDHILNSLKELHAMELETNNPFDLNMHLKDDKDALNMSIENDDNPLVNNVEYVKKVHANVVVLPYYFNINAKDSHL